MVLIKGSLVSGLYVLQGSVITGEAATTSGSDDQDLTQLWNLRLGHMSEKGLSILGKQNLLSGYKGSRTEFCEHCVFGKQTGGKFSKTAVHSTKRKLDYIHSDLWGPNKVASKSGARYYMTLIDDYSRMVWVYFLKTKDEAFPTFVRWKTMVEKQTDRKVKRLRTDNGLEFCNHAFNDFCSTEGIVRHRTCAGTPQQNGIAERMNRMLCERARSMLSHSGLGQEFWAEAINTACYLVNRSPSTAIECRTLFEVWSDSHADYPQLRVFGCPAYAHVRDGKLEPRARKCVFLGYASGVKGYRLWCNDKKSPGFIISRDVTFNESASLTKEKENTGADTDHDTEEWVEIEVDAVVQSSSGDEVQIGAPELQQTYSITTGRERRQIRPPTRYVNMVAYALTVAESLDLQEPSSYREAISGSDADQWIGAMDEEIESLRKNQTWQLVSLPEGQKVVNCKWVFKKKKGIAGVKAPRYKARLVAKGFTQRQGIDFT